MRKKVLWPFLCPTAHSHARCAWSAGRDGLRESAHLLQSAYLEEGLDLPEVIEAVDDLGFAVANRRSMWRWPTLLQNAMLSFVLHLAVFSILVSVPKNVDTPRSPFLEVHLVMLESGDATGADGGGAGGGEPVTGPPGAENPLAMELLAPEPSPPPVEKPPEKTSDPIAAPAALRPQAMSKPTKSAKAPTLQRETRVAEPPSSTPSPSGEAVTLGSTAPGKNLEESGEGGSGTVGTSHGRGLHPRHGGGPVDAEFGAANGPKFAHKSLPNYPRLAQQQGKEGTVVLRVTIDESGRPIVVEAVKTAGAGFDEEAIKAIKASHFHPAKREGKPVVCRALLPIRFELRGSD